MKNYQTLLLATFLIAANLSYGTTRKVLFIGNSYTYTNNMPLMLQAFAAAKGDTLIYDESDPGSYTFQMHSTYAPTITKIFSQKWDVVVLQDQSQEPAFPPDQVATDVYPYAHTLDSLVHANDSCTQTMFMMTWGHANGDPDNCAGYPVICTYDGMQQRLRESYLQMTQDNHAIVAPVGAAWKVVRDSFPALSLYMADNIHPIVPGSYLETSVLYGSIFHKKALNCTYTDGVAAADAHTLQRIADKVTLDSISQWQQYGHYPDAAFTHTQSGPTVTFSKIDPVTSTFHWSFGDGASDITANPVHLYTAAGSYVVSHSAVTDCFTEVQKDTIHIATTGIDNVNNAAAYPIEILQNGKGQVTFKLPATHIYDMLEVYDSKGSCVKKYSLNNSSITDNFVPGFYIYRAYSADRSVLMNGKLIIY